MCINRLYLGLEALCIHNPATGREETIPHVVARSAGPARRVVVVGAGPAGLEAARVAAERGHSVVAAGGGGPAGRPGRARGSGDGAARRPHRDRRLAGGGVPRASAWTCGLGVVADEAAVAALDAGRRDRRDRRSAAAAAADGGRRPRRDDLGHHRRRGHRRRGARCSCSTTTAPRTPCRAPSGWSRPGRSLEIVTPDRHVGHEVTGTAYPALSRDASTRPASG